MTWRKAVVKGYREVWLPGRRRQLHRVRAERALGRPLPAGAVVHHADGSRSDTAPLVICQDDIYHRLLHSRMRIVAAGGNPNTDSICWSCRSVKPREDFCLNAKRLIGVNNRCKACAATAKARDYLKMKQRADKEADS
jgi:HNH endonuclease